MIFCKKNKINQDYKNLREDSLKIVNDFKQFVTKLMTKKPKAISAIVKIITVHDQRLFVFT